MATGSTGISDPITVDTGSLSMERVTSMNNAIQGLHSVVQAGNMSAGIPEIIQQVIDITKHSVALHSKVDGITTQVQNMGSDIEAKLAIPVKDKIIELEQKGSHLTSEVRKAIEALKQQDNQSFMDLSNVKSATDNTRTG